MPGASAAASALGGWVQRVAIRTATSKADSNIIAPYFRFAVIGVSPFENVHVMTGNLSYRSSSSDSIQLGIPGIRRGEDRRAWNEILLRRGRRAGRHLAKDFLGVNRLFGRGHIAGRLDEFAKLSVCHVGLIHPEAIDEDAVRRFLVGPAKVGVGAHREFAAGNPDYAGRRSIRETLGGESNAESSQSKNQENYLVGQFFRSDRPLRHAVLIN